MGHQIIQQLDGKLCVWSTFTDSVVIVDATPEELIEHYAQRAAEQSRKETRRVVDLVVAGKTREAYHQFAMTYEEAVERSTEPLP